jgi:hypothetical protein
MSSLNVRHPEDGTLLEYLDGELTRRQARKVQDHLKACWQCRTELEELQAAVNECVRYRKQVMIPCMPEPPAAWGRLDFARVDAELARESFTARLGRWLSPRRNTPLRWALSGVMALALAIAIVQQLRETPKVEAAALLRKAVAASGNRPHTVRRLRILSSRGPMTRIGGVASVRPAAGEMEIARHFEAARYDWNDPLSARAYAAWRETLARKVEEVSTADPAVYRIKTTTPDSELSMASLDLRKTDFAPVAARFEFADREWVEVTESVDQLDSPASTVAGATGGTLRQPGVPPGPSSQEIAAAEPAPPAPSEELQVVAALHQVGADLGDPLEISREGGEVVVSGAGISPQRQQQIHNQLDRLPHVVVRFSDPVLPAGTPALVEPATTRDAAVSTERPTYTARIEQRLGGRPQFERFSGQLLDWTDSAMSRAYALHRLAQQFTAASEGAMGAADRRTLRSLAREHLAAMRNNLAKVQTTVTPVLNGIGAAAGATDSHPAPAAWQAASERVLASGHRVEYLLAVVLGAAPGGTAANAPADLMTALNQLNSDIEQCQRLLSYD